MTTRGHIHWVVTEHGMVNLFGMNMEQRAKALIAIADPSQRKIWNDMPTNVLENNFRHRMGFIQYKQMFL